MRKLLVLLGLLGACFCARAQSSPLLIGGWNRFPTAADAAWWEQNAHYYDHLHYDAVLHVLEAIDFTVMDRVIAEDQKRHYQVIVTIDGTRNVVDVLKFFERYGTLQNAGGQPLIAAAIIGWDRVNNLHPDADYATLRQEMQAASDLARIVNPALPVYLCVSYAPGTDLESWYATMQSIPHSGIWLHDVWGYNADLEAPLAWIKSKGETNIILGNVYGFKYFSPAYRVDLIRRAAKAFPKMFQNAARAGYAGVSLTSNFDTAKQFGGTTFLGENGQPNELFAAIASQR